MQTNFRLLNTVIFDSIEDRFKSRQHDDTSIIEATTDINPDYNLPVINRFHLNIQQAKALLAQEPAKLAVDSGLESRQLETLNQAIEFLANHTESNYLELFKNTLGDFPDINPNLLMLMMLKRLGLEKAFAQQRLGYEEKIRPERATHPDSEIELLLQAIGKRSGPKIKNDTPISQFVEAHLIDPESYERMNNFEGVDINQAIAEYQINRILDEVFMRSYNENPYLLPGMNERIVLDHMEFLHSIPKGPSYLAALDQMLAANYKFDPESALYVVITKTGNKDKYDDFGAEAVGIRRKTTAEKLDDAIKQSAWADGDPETQLIQEHRSTLQELWFKKDPDGPSKLEATLMQSSSGNHDKFWQAYQKFL